MHPVGHALGPRKSLEGDTVGVPVAQAELVLEDGHQLAVPVETPAGQEDRPLVHRPAVLFLDVPDLGLQACFHRRHLCSDLLDCTVDQLADAGVPTEVVIIPGLVHAALNMSAYVPRSNEILQAVVPFLRGHLGATDQQGAIKSAAVR